MRRSRLSSRRRPTSRLRLGRDFLIAMCLLTVGIALPLASALADPRIARLTAQAGSGDTAVLPAPPVIAAPVEGAAIGAPDQPLATLVPIVPTPIPLIPTPPVASAVDQPLQALAAPAPILMYHYIRTVDASLDPLGYELSVTPELFDQQMAWLAQNGYTGVRVDTLVRCLHGEPICPPRPVALSFDDGYADAYDAALPVLQRYGFRATFYIVSGFIGQPGYMGWDQLAALRDAGMEIGAHSVDHAMLTRLDLTEMARQIGQSKQDLERGLDMAVTSFCFPVGDYDATVVDQVRAAGYASAVTTRWDNNYADMLTLPRRRVAGGTTAEELGWIVSN